MMKYYFPLNTTFETTEFCFFLFESDTVIDRILNFDHNKGGFSFCGAKIPIWLMFLELLLSFYTKWKCLGHPGQDLPLDNFLQRAANKRYLSCRNKKNIKMNSGVSPEENRIEGVLPWVDCFKDWSKGTYFDGIFLKKETILVQNHCHSHTFYGRNSESFARLYLLHRSERRYNHI